MTLMKRNEDVGYGKGVFQPPPDASKQLIIDELIEQSKTSVPAIFGMLLYKLPWLISLHFLGQIGAEELAAAALAMTVCDVTGMSLCYGLSSAMTTLAGQARGELLRRGQQRMIAKKRKEQLEEAEKWIVDEEWEDVRNVGESFGLKSDADPLYDSIVVEVDRARADGNLEKEDHIDINDNNSATASTMSTEEEDNVPLLTMTYLYRGLFIELALVVPVGCWWLYGVKPLLLRLGQGLVLSEMTQQYLRILTPGLWSYSINWTLTAWLQAIEMADVPAYAAFVGCICHIPFNLFFIYVLDWGYKGVGVSTVMFQIIQPFLMLIYLYGTPHGRNRVLDNIGARAVGQTHLSFWKEASAAVSSFEGIAQYLSLAVPGIIVISEWWASELAIFLAGRLEPNPAFALDGMTIYQSLNSFCFMFPVGISVAGSARVGNVLGADDTEGADLASKVSVASAAILSAAVGNMLYFTPHTFFPSIFSPDEDVILETSRIIPLLSLYVFADGIQVALNGIIKGCGRQCVTIPIVIIAYWVVGLPLAYYLAFVKNGGHMCDDEYFCGIVGLVGGMTCGTWVHAFLLALTVVCTTDWEVEARKTRERLSLERRGRWRGRLIESSPLISRGDYMHNEDASITSIKSM